MEKNFNNINSLLYSDQYGNIIGLDEVQLLDPAPVDRIDSLKKLLNSEDIYLAYQSALILTAWGVKEGVEKLNQFIEGSIASKNSFEPHRLNNEDNIYDVISDALHLAILSGYNRQIIIIMLSKILEKYGQYFFESKLKYVLLDLNTPELLQAVEQAIKDAIENNRKYQASQLLPVLAKYDKKLAINYLDIFRKLSSEDERIQFNIEETKSMINKMK